MTVNFLSSSNRIYTLLACTNLAEGIWTDLPGQTDVPGSGELQGLTDANAVPARFYRIGVRVP